MLSQSSIHRVFKALVHTMTEFEQISLLRMLVYDFKDPYFLYTSNPILIPSIVLTKAGAAENFTTLMTVCPSDHRSSQPIPGHILHLDFLRPLRDGASIHTI